VKDLGVENTDCISLDLS